MARVRRQNAALVRRSAEVYFLSGGAANNISRVTKIDYSTYRHFIAPPVWESLIKRSLEIRNRQRKKEILEKKAKVIEEYIRTKDTYAVLAKRMNVSISYINKALKEYYGIKEEFNTEVITLQSKINEDIQNEREANGLD